MSISAFGIEHDGCAIEKRKNLRQILTAPSMQNSRSENVRGGAAQGGAIVGGTLGGLGALAGTSEARGGIKALKSVGAKPGARAGARMITTHGGRIGGPAALAGAALGGTYGALVGATLPARKKRRAANTNDKP
jgi:hypothetical protein